MGSGPGLDETGLLVATVEWRPPRPRWSAHRPGSAASKVCRVDEEDDRLQPDPLGGNPALPSSVSALSSSSAGQAVQRVRVRLLPGDDVAPGVVDDVVRREEAQGGQAGAALGTSTRRIPSAAACVVACTPPMPPKATRSSRRASPGEREHPADGVGHVGVHEPDGGGGGLLGVEAERGAQASQRRGGRLTTELHPPMANAPCRAGPAPGRHRSLWVPSRPGRSSRVRARTRPTVAPHGGRRTPLPGDRPSPAPTDGMCDHGDADAVAVPPVPIHLDLGTTIADEAQVVAGASHVHTDHVTETGIEPRPSGRDHAPPVGPEPIVATARRAAALAVATPPADVATSSSCVNPAAASRSVSRSR